MQIFPMPNKLFRYECMEYILKPVEREGLTKVLHKVVAMNDSVRTENTDRSEYGTCLSCKKCHIGDSWKV